MEKPPSRFVMSDASDLRQIRMLLEAILREVETIRTHLRTAATAVEAAATPPVARGRRRRGADPALAAVLAAPRHEALYAALTAFAVKQRRKFAQQKGWTRTVGYIPFADVEMEYVARARPATMDDLLALPGFGPWKGRKFGNEILRIVAAHRDQPGG